MRPHRAEPHRPRSSAPADAPRRALRLVALLVALASCRPYLSTPGTPAPSPGSDAAAPGVCGHEREGCCADGPAPCSPWLSCRPALIGYSCVPCGTPNEPCCLAGTACQSGLGCGAPDTWTRERRCEPCGGPDQPCCASGSSCNGAGSCVVVAGVAICQFCGGAGESCCANDVCNPGMFCQADSSGARRCGGCGGADQPCCPGRACSDGSLRCVDDFRGPRCEHCGAVRETCCERACQSGARCLYGACVALSDDAGADGGVVDASVDGGGTAAGRAGEACWQDNDCIPALYCIPGSAAVATCSAPCFASSSASEEAACGLGGVCVNNRCALRCEPSPDAGPACPDGSLCDGDDPLPMHAPGCAAACRSERDCAPGAYCNPRTLSCQLAPPRPDASPDGVPCRTTDTAPCRGYCRPLFGSTEGVCASVIDTRVTAACPDMSPAGPMTPVPDRGGAIARCWRIECPTGCECPSGLDCNGYSDGSRRCGAPDEPGRVRAFACSAGDAGARDAGADAP